MTVSVESEYQDQTIICRDCSKEFVFTAKGQAFFASQTPPFSPPVRCKDCRVNKRARMEKPKSRGGDFNGSNRRRES